MKKSLRKTLGIAGPVFVSNAANTPGETTFATFVTGGSDGEIAIFNEAGTKVTGALSAGTKYFIAQIVGDQVKKTPLFVYKGSEHSDYVGGTKHAASISAPATIAKDDQINISIIDTTPYLYPLDNYEYNVVAKNTSVADTLAELIVLINDPLAIENDSLGKMVQASLISSQTTYSEFDANVTFTKGSKAVTFAADDNTHGAGNDQAAAGDFVYAKGEVYQIESVTNLTATTGSLTLDRPYTGDTETIDVTTASGTDSAGIIAAASIGDLSVKLTALEYDVHFQVGAAVESEGVESALSIAYTNFVKSVGRPENVTLWEEEGAVWEGYRTLNIAHAEDFGKPTYFTISTNTYQAFSIRFENEQKSVAPPNVKDYYKGNITVFLLNSSNQWDTQFGL